METPKEKTMLNQKVKNLYTQWKEIMFNPDHFFNNLNPKEKYREATKYFLKLQALVSGISLLFMAWLIAFTGAKDFTTLLGISGGELFFFTLVVLILLYPVILLFSWGMLYVNAGIMHLFVLLFGGKQGYAQTFKSVAYSISPNIFAMVPFVNWACWGYTLVLEIFALNNLQKLNWAKSIAAVLVPTVLIICIFLIIYLRMIMPLMLTGVPA